MSKFMARWFCIGLFFSALVFTGCGQRELAKKDTYPAEGRITLNGEPVKGVMVVFEPTDPSKGAAASGATDGDGNFKLHTYSNGDPDGAVPGEYKLILEDFDPARMPAIAKGVEPTKIPAELKKPDKTYVIEAGPNNLTIDLP